MSTMGFTKQTSLKQEDESILIPETFTHAVGIGQTGSGKTTSFIYPNLRHRLEQGHGLLVYDYKGKEHSYVKHFADKAERINDVVEIGKPWGASVNLIRHMSNEDLSHFFEGVLAHSDENRYWALSAKSLAIDVLDVIGALEELRTCYERSGKSFSKDPTHFSTHNFSYPTTKTISSLFECTRSLMKLIDFIDNLDKLKESLYERIKTEINIAQKRSRDESVKDEFDDILMSYTKLENIIESAQQSLEIYSDPDSKSLKTILAALVTPISQISQNSFFNTDSLDIVEALNSAKIIIINTTGLSDTILQNLNASIFDELSKRSRLRKINPVTVFIDEAHRVLSRESDLPVDLLREAKVDVVLTFQDKSFVIDKIGKEKFRGLMANLSSQYYFHSNNVEESVVYEQRLELLSTFEYVTNLDAFHCVHTGQPVFIDEHTKLLSEYIYQQQHRILHRYAKAHRGKKIILEYLPKLFTKGQLIAYDLNTEREFIIDHEDPAQRLQCEKIFDSIFVSHEMDGL